MSYRDCEVKREYVLRTIDHLLNNGYSIPNITPDVISITLQEEFRNNGINCIITIQSYNEIINPTLNLLKMKHRQQTIKENKILKGMSNINLGD